MRFLSIVLFALAAACGGQSSSPDATPPEPVRCGATACAGATAACCEPATSTTTAPTCGAGCDYLKYDAISCRGAANCKSNEVCCYAYNKGSGTYTQDCTTTACNGYLQHSVP